MDSYALTSQLKSLLENGKDILETVDTALEAAYSEGRDSGFSEGRTEGYADGKAEGYDIGFEAGKDADD